VEVIAARLVRELTAPFFCKRNGKREKNKRKLLPKPSKNLEKN
jgi:hypothetical protein